MESEFAYSTKKSNMTYCLFKTTRRQKKRNAECEMFNFEGLFLSLKVKLGGKK